MRYKTLYLTFLTLLLSASVSYGAKNILHSPTPSWVKPIPIPATGKIADRDISDGYYYLLFDEQTNVGTSTFFRHIALNIINDIGVQNASEIEISYDPGY